MFVSFLNWPGRTRRFLAFTHDMTATAAALLFAYYIRFQTAFWAYAFDDFLLVLAGLLPAAAVVYTFVGLYRGIWRFASIPDLEAILKAATILAGGLIVADFVARGAIVIPRSVVATYWLAQCAFLGGARLLYRMYRDLRISRTLSRKSENAAPILILGAGPDAEVLIRALETTARDSLFAVGLLTQSRAHVGQVIRGVPVLGTLEDLEDVCRDLEIKTVRVQRVIVGSDTFEDYPGIEDTIARARRMGLSVDRPHFLRDQGRRAGYLTRFQPVQIEDVVGRKARDIDLEPMRRLISGRRVLVTGGGGSIGSEICRQVAQMGCERLMVVENSEFALYGVAQQLGGMHAMVSLDAVLCDIRMRDSVFRRMRAFRPDIVFHAAAYKHVPILESQPHEAVNANVLGTMNVADAAVATGASAFVLISSDKAVDPVSVMGATKRAAEIYCEAVGMQAEAGELTGDDGAPARTRFVSVRFGNVLGTSGSVVPLFNEQIARGGPVTVTHPQMERFFMTVSEAVSLVLLASAHGISAAEHPSILALDMGRQIRIIDLAERMIRLAGLEPGQDIRIEFTGLRQGERLSEILFADQEDLLPTQIDGVFSATPRIVNPHAVRARFAALSDTFADVSPGALRARLGELVPEFAAAPADAPEQAGGSSIDVPAA